MVSQFFLNLRALSNLIVVLFVASLLLSCGKSIRDEAAPRNCVAIVFEVNKTPSGAHLDEIERFVRGLRGENPYPEISFQMAKGFSGKTVFRATRKAGVDLDALRSDVETWLKLNPSGDVTVRYVSDTGEVKFHAPMP